MPFIVQRSPHKHGISIFFCLQVFGEMVQRFSVLESARLVALERYGVLDTLPEQACDDLALVAARVMNTPMAMLSFIDAERQWIKAQFGADLQNIRREHSFCGQTILRRDPLVVLDAQKDTRFNDSPLVTEQPHIRFYCGFPVVTSEGYAIGSLAVLDSVPHEAPTEQQMRTLSTLVRLVGTQLETRLLMDSVRKMSMDREIYLAQLESYKTKLEKANSELQERSLTDKLTGVGNRAAFDARLEEEVYRSQRYDSELSLLIVDVDHFKGYNDTYGHLQGDEILQQVAQVLRSCARPSDAVFRYGGEEFAIILPATGRDGAYVMAERLRMMVRSSSPVTVSIGCGSMNEAKDGMALIKEADLALYAAKRAGRDRVSTYPADTSHYPDPISQRFAASGHK